MAKVETKSAVNKSGLGATGKGQSLRTDFFPDCWIKDEERMEVRIFCDPLAVSLFKNIFFLFISPHAKTGSVQSIPSEERQSSQLRIENEILEAVDRQVLQRKRQCNHIGIRFEKCFYEKR